MPSISIRVINDKLYQGLTRVGEAIPRVTNAKIEAVMNDAQAEMQTPGDPVTYPIAWDSDRQRAAYFASNGFGAGIPYQRDGGYEQGWRVEQTGYGTDRGFRLYNDDRAAKYVGGSAAGTGQSNIHKGRWKVLKDVVSAHAAKLLADTSAAVHQVLASWGIGL